MSTCVLTPNMPSWAYTPMVQRGKRRFLTASCSIKYHQEITRLPQAIHQPPEIAVIHRKGHRKGTEEVSEGNRLAEAAAKSAARSATPWLPPLVWGGSMTQEGPCSSEERQRATEQGHTPQSTGGLQAEDGRLLLSAAHRWKVWNTLH